MFLINAKTVNKLLVHHRAVHIWTYLVYSVSDNVTRGHHILHDFHQVALEQFVQSRFGVTHFRQGLNSLRDKMIITANVDSLKKIK